MAKTGDYEWTNYRLFIRWQAVRRCKDFKDFCDKYEQYFDDDGMIDTWRLPATAEKNVNVIKDKFGLDLIYHYSASHSVDEFIDNCVFENPFAVDYLSKPDESKHFKSDKNGIEEYNPLWDERHIVLKVNISEGIPSAQLIDEFKECVEHARELADIEDVRSIPDEKDFEIYDLLNAGKNPKEIIKTIWPNDYNKEFVDDEFKKDKLYDKLANKYETQGLKDWDVKAFEEAYGQQASGRDYKTIGPQKFYMRVSDAVGRVKKYMSKI